jgi:flagellar hook-basal body complex protein FliE
MAIDPVSVSGLTQPLSREALGGPSEASGGGLVSPGSFPNMLNQLLQAAAHSHGGAEAAVRDLALGQTDNLHGVMLQMAQADLTFHLILEIRNRLTEAYQEIMKMPM